ncbi:MAG: hypothetical protein R3250_04115, partial [Melioribacteraceae bacterium]|nr:hypothetical protein [Melioribacteraceae bacterium]
AQDVNRPRARPIYPEASRIRRVQDETPTQEQNVGRVMQERVFQTLNQLSPNPETEQPIPSTEEIIETANENNEDTILVNGEIFGVDGLHIIPHDIGYIQDEDRDFLIENAWRLNIEAIVMRDIIDNHNARELAQNGTTEIFPASTPAEDYDLSDTGFSEDNISRILPHRNRIEVEETDDRGEERPDGGRPT